MQRNGWKQGAIIFGGITLMAFLPLTASATVFEFDEDGNVTSRPSLNYIQRAQSSASSTADLTGSGSLALALPMTNGDVRSASAPVALDGLQLAARSR